MRPDRAFKTVISLASILGMSWLLFSILAGNFPKTGIVIFLGAGLIY